MRIFRHFAVGAAGLAVAITLVLAGVSTPAVSATGVGAKSGKNFVPRPGRNPRFAEEKVSVERAKEIARAAIRQPETVQSFSRPTPRWQGAGSGNATCRNGARQSPLDIAVAGVARLAPLRFHYKISQVRLMLDGDTVTAQYGRGSHITIGDEEYQLESFRFRTPSEHRIAGRAFPMEMQFFHRSGTGRLMAVSILVAFGEENLAARELWQKLPAIAAKRGKEADVLMNARDLVPVRTHYFRYAGSLTEPPCTEDVDWLVLETPVRFSLDQVGRMRGLVGLNARPVQARNGRYLVQGTAE